MAVEPLYERSEPLLSPCKRNKTDDVVLRSGLSAYPSFDVMHNNLIALAAVQNIVRSRTTIV